jgi:hypothetical protein
MKLLLQRTTLLVGIWLVLGAPPADLIAQETVSYDVPLETRQRSFPSDLRRSLLEQSIEVSEVSLKSGTVDRVLNTFEGDPAVAIVLVDRQSGEIIPARRSGDASFSVGASTSPPKGCRQSCADWKNPRRIKLDNARSTVSAPGIGDIEVQMLPNANAAGAVDVATGRTYVEWPVIIRVPRSDTFERNFTKRVVFRGFGQLSQEEFLVVDVASIEVPDGRIFDVIASHSVDLPGGN